MPVPRGLLRATFLALVAFGLLFQIDLSDATNMTSSTTVPTSTSSKNNVESATSSGPTIGINMTTAHESSVHNVHNDEIMKVLAILFYIVTGTSIFSFIAVLIAVVYSSCCKHPGRFRFADEEAVNLLDDTDDSGGSSPFGSGSRRGFQIPAGFCSSSPYQRLDTRDWDEEEEASAARERMKHDPENVIYFRKDGNLDTSFVNPNYGRGSPLTIESHLSDNEEDPIRYYVSVYDELTASEMEEPSNSTSWQIPKLMKVATQPVSLRDPEYD
ncbi:envelope glycoprotein UL132 [Human betaherpesvirus 5]|uniref:Envelope glycoprotein UL132 n=1 Tax=Human cytomegalovirus TaxID=10359 RepID=A0A0G2UF73_HCMV|nr:envelope glycoprotein UL132 [Human betaherpesvirus 5]